MEKPQIVLDVFYILIQWLSTVTDSWRYDLESIL